VGHFQVTEVNDDADDHVEDDSDRYIIDPLKLARIDSATRTTTTVPTTTERRWRLLRCPTVDRSDAAPSPSSAAVSVSAAFVDFLSVFVIFVVTADNLNPPAIVI
jgi:hypothetical protein